MTGWTFAGKAKRLENVDIPRIGATIGVGEDEIHAFMDVEAAGSGFDASGRPKMLFEPHIFYRRLGPGKARDKAVAQGLAYAKWKPGTYPKDSYPRLAKAMQINSTVALMSASWGLGQIMGFNHAAAGYMTPEEMVRDFMEDEDNHLEAMVRLLVNFKLDDDLRAHRWDVIERVYNGGGYGGAYARKMAKAFAKWQGIKDTPWKAVQPQAPVEPQKPEKPDEAKTEPTVANAGPSLEGGALTGVVAGGGAGIAMGFPWWWVAFGVAVIVAGYVAVKIYQRRT